MILQSVKAASSHYEASMFLGKETKYDLEIIYQYFEGLG